MSENEQRLQHLTNALLAGKAEEARQSAHAALAQGSTANEILDALVEAANILADLHEIGEYEQNRLALAEGAINTCLQVIDEQLGRSEGRFNVKATVGPVGLKAGGLLSTVISAALRSVGFHSINLSKTQTPLELLRNSEELGADLVVPLLPGDGAELHLRSFMEEIERGGFKSKFEIIPVVPGLPDTVQVTITVARNSGEAITKATEWALKRQPRRGNE